MQVVALFHQLGHTPRLVGHAVVGDHLVLHPVAFFLEAEGGDKVVVVREIVQAVEGRNVLVALYQHTLLAERIVIQRAVDLGHPLLAGPLLGGADEEARNFDVVYAVEPAEAYALGAVTLVVAGIDNGADASYHFTPVQGEPHLTLAVQKTCTFGKRVYLIDMKCRDILGAVLVERIGEFDKAHQFRLGFDFLHIKHSLQS